MGFISMSHNVQLSSPNSFDFVYIRLQAMSSKEDLSALNEIRVSKTNISPSSDHQSILAGAVTSW